MTLLENIAIALVCKTSSSSSKDRKCALAWWKIQPSSILADIILFHIYRLKVHLVRFHSPLPCLHCFGQLWSRETQEVATQNHCWWQGVPQVADLTFVHLISDSILKLVFSTSINHIHRSWCHQRLMTSFEWTQHFTNCLWKCPDCNRAPLKHVQKITQHIRYHERQQSKIARLNQEH